MKPIYMTKAYFFTLITLTIFNSAYFLNKVTAINESNNTNKELSSSDIYITFGFVVLSGIISMSIATYFRWKKHPELPLQIILYGDE